MNRQRAWQLYCKCGDSFRMRPQFEHVPEITETEKKEVLIRWKKLHGGYSFAGALANMAETLSE